MARPESRFCVNIVNLLLDKMLFGHAEQSELKLIGLSYTVNTRQIERKTYSLLCNEHCSSSYYSVFFFFQTLFETSISCSFLHGFSSNFQVFCNFITLASHYKTMKKSTSGNELLPFSHFFRAFGFRLKAPKVQKLEHCYY